MNRYPIWKYAIIAIALVLGFIYSLPNFFPDAPAVQISSARATVQADAATLTRAEQALKQAGISHTGAVIEPTGIRIRFVDTDTQLRARDVIARTLNPDPSDEPYIVALNLLPNTPRWLAALGGMPMYLGLDLRGGVHFLLQIDMDQAVSRRMDTATTDLRVLMRERNIRHGGITRTADAIEIRFRDAETRERALRLLADTHPELAVVEAPAEAGETRLIARLRPEAQREVMETALRQNITTLHNRINELGVAEPVIQQQGAERVIVQLPGVQDVARAKDILGRTATLEARLVDLSNEAQAAVLNQGPVPFGSQLFRHGRGAPVVLRAQPIFTGEQLTNAGATFDEHQRPAVAITLNEAAGRVLREVSRENIKRPMAIVLFERGRGEVLTVATIQSELGSRFQITGLESPRAANDLALLLRAGALAAPMEIIEERTIGPSLGADNIRQGFYATLFGFIAICVFISVYYSLFGVFSTVALTVNLMLLIGLLSLLQATLTLPGIAALALALGMAIDANVLINERIREELRNGASPQAAIATGYERAWATILDSNVTTLIAGVALLIFGSGPIRGFAIVHSLGILTSMFSAVFVSRAIVNLWYGRQKKLAKLSIGTTEWKPRSA
ncbi:MAG TPA: protein translocase subunit SecD [Burkholderiaceae bacterium]|nr:protein translocase subunit SecD [Burkholderiaceae bacterium]